MKLKIENPFLITKRNNILYEEINTERIAISKYLRSYNENVKDEKTSINKTIFNSTKTKEVNEKLSLVEKMPNFTNNFNELIKNLSNTKQITQEEPIKKTLTLKKSCVQEKSLTLNSKKKSDNNLVLKRVNQVELQCLCKRESKNKTLKKSNLENNTKLTLESKSEKNKIPFGSSKNNLKKDKILSEREIASHLKAMTNSEEIKDFYKYTERCIKSMKMLTTPTAKEIKELQKTVRFKEDIINKKLAVFDLDETLIHSEAKNQSDCDCVLEVMFPNMGLANIGVNFRPNIISSLKRIRNHYMLVVYTASHQAYADTILDYLDPERTLFSYRLYRNNCLKLKLGEETVYVKDLRIFKSVDLKNIVIVDNSVLSFAFQLESGIPILPFYNNKRDNEMKILENYLISISQKDDLRVENTKYIKLQIFRKKTNESSSSNSEIDTISIGNLSYEMEEDSHVVKLISCSLQPENDKEENNESSLLEKRVINSIKTN